nr:MAG TPA_asm: hypothetical protein [Caudoviricetes sp.]
MRGDTAQRHRMITLTVMDEIVMNLATLRVYYGRDIDGNSVTSVSWEDPETGTVADSIIRAGIISHLQELEVDSTFEGWDE